MLRSVIAALLLPFLAGCIASDVPAITARSAENVGGSIQYFTYATENGARVADDIIRLTRRTGNAYQMQIGQTDTPGFMRFANGLYVRQLGSRGASPVYLVQFDLAKFGLDADISPEAYGFRYLVYPVAIDADGFGTVGRIDCANRKAAAMAGQYGITLACVDLDAWAIPRAGESATPESLWAFLTQALREDAFTWEDVTGVSVLDPVMRF